jgi:hypothetical protein
MGFTDSNFKARGLVLHHFDFSRQIEFQVDRMLAWG